MIKIDNNLWKILILEIFRFRGRYCVIGQTSTPLAGGGRGAGADHASANLIPTNLIMMKGAQVGVDPPTWRRQRTISQLSNESINPIVRFQTYNSQVEPVDFIEFVVKSNFFVFLVLFILSMLSSVFFFFFLIVSFLLFLNLFTFEFISSCFLIDHR